MEGCNSSNSFFFSTKSYHVLNNGPRRGARKSGICRILMEFSCRSQGNYLNRENSFDSGKNGPVE